MTNEHYLQKGVIAWFLLQPKAEKKARTVQTACLNLYKQISGEISSKYKYRVIHPLLKFGVLEYYENSYRLSPSCALQKASNIIFCNIPESNLLQSIQPCLYNSGLGIEVYESSGHANSFLNKYGISCQQFKLTALIQKISIAKTIESWQQVKVLDTTGYQTLDESNTWQAVKRILPGVYKTGKEDYARRLMMISENNWRALSANWNDYPIAVLWSKIQNNFPFLIQYHQKEGLLCLNSEHFPLILERLFLINTLLEGKFTVETNRRQYYLNASEFTILNKIFHDRISVI